MIDYICLFGCTVLLVCCWKLLEKSNLKMKRWRFQIYKKREPIVLELSSVGDILLEGALFKAQMLATIHVEDFGKTMQLGFRNACSYADVVKRVSAVNCQNSLQAYLASDPETNKG